MTRRIGSTALYLATSERGTTPAAEQAARLRDIVIRLRACQADLSKPSDAETVQLLAVAILQLQMRLSRVGNDELKLLSDQLFDAAAASDGPKARGSA